MSETFDQMDAEAEARRVLEQYQQGRLPVDPFEIARKAEITVTPKQSSEPGVSGFLVRLGNKFGIAYATNIVSHGFIRFTVSHELGHYFLPGHPEHLLPPGITEHRSRSGFLSSDRFERQADYFAAALLMPEAAFRKEMVGAGEGLEAIEKLAAIFETSITATAIRFVRLAEGPAAVVMSSGRRIEYCFMSDRIREVPGIQWIAMGEFLSKGTITYKFNENPSHFRDKNRVQGTCNLDDWFDNVPDLEVSEDVIGLGGYGKTLTFLYTDEDLEEASCQANPED